MTARLPVHTAEPVRGGLIALIAFAAVAPLVLMTAPALASQLATQFGLGPERIGLLFSVELGAMSLATLPAYLWLPRVDWRRAAACAGGLFIAANLASCFASTYAELLPLRLLSALAGGSLMILCLSTAAASPNPDRAYGLWVSGQLALGALGLVLFPGWFARYGIAACYLSLAALMALCLPLARWFPPSAAKPGGPGGAKTPPWRPVVIGAAATLCFYISLSGTWTFIGSIAGQAGLTPEQSGDWLALATLMGIAGSVCAAAIGGRGQRRRLLIAGYGLMLLALALLLGAPRVGRFAAAALAFKYAWTFILPFILATLAALDHSGRLMNTVNLAIGGGLALGPSLAGELMAAHGQNPQTLLLVSMGLAALSLALLLTLRPATARSPQ
ncbi:MFS transporter [Chromobacterium haemolyticum]|uniref:MFS transporter n=1 Tax=Chromobacterium haemolyticum TaxID=394935 RepID=A0ABS3GRB5_9NEIS|nr:MFS transporter [Chromobacterium haemolyticum]MBK0416367.1 MFS transporter [Chromobacterium haemolyticum]MBO0417489.1 MFS transporter [Chromobacterium haemolyticum]MBO0500754.1 MFS transporter [Chromobacterium haemolyticum]QOD81009.1 MFS transporter [Chromobacterium haemolyticum]BBH13644.1 MFS transporter [Chromobacterium haemolyticum]